MENQSNFIKTIIENDLKENKKLKIITRFPPEPNGYLHIGHARAIVINFELAKYFKGYTNLRVDDTNPEKESPEFVKAIKEDITWLGYKPKGVYFASNYFPKMKNLAIKLIKKGLAYVDDQSADEIQKTRGDLKTPGIDSPFRNRDVLENLKLFNNMLKGKYKEGEKVLRAKIDMKSDNMNNRDPIIYRISNLYHHNTKDKWKIYPMYDFAHPLEDAIEKITHSLCSLEFEDHRPVYDWFVKNCDMKHKPRQIEFGRLNIEKMVLSKRYLRELVENKLVSGWDDPRMPTLKGMRKRGYTPNGIRNFILDTGLSKTNGEAKLDMLEHFVREDLKNISEPISAVLDPLLVEITNYDFSKEVIDVDYKFRNGKRKVYFSKYIYIDKSDFSIDKPNKDYKRLYLGGEVRLMNAYFIKCNDVVYDENKNIVKLLCTYDKETKSGSGFNLRKPNGTINYVNKDNSYKIRANIYEPLLDENEQEKDPIKRFNKNSHKIKNGFIEKSIKDFKIGDHIQFIRQGYFILDDFVCDEYIFNETVKLKSNYKK